MMNSLLGEILTHIDIDENNDQIMLTTESGRKIMIYHIQDCCESVRIESVSGDCKKLIGKAILVSDELVYSGDPPDEYSESWTRTDLTFKVNDETVIVRWIGESNGYYSESVDFQELR